MERVKGKVDKLERKNGCGGNTYRSILWDSAEGGPFGHFVQCYPDSEKSHPFSMEEELEYMHGYWTSNNEGLDFPQYLEAHGKYADPKFEGQRQSIIQKIAKEGFIPGKADQDGSPQ